MKIVFKYSISSILSSLVLFIVLFISISNINDQNISISAFKDTTYDFMISGFLTDNESDIILANDNVNKSVRFYNFRLSIDSINTNVMLTPDIENVDLSLYNSNILMEGSYEQDKAVIDTKFATVYNLKINDIVRFSLNGNIIEKEISGIFISSDISAFHNGVLVAEWIPEYDDYFEVDLTYDVMFIIADDIPSVENFLLSNDYTYINRINELSDIIYSSSPVINSSISNTIIVSIVLLIANITVYMILYKKDSKQILINIKEVGTKEEKDLKDSKQVLIKIKEVGTKEKKSFKVSENMKFINVPIISMITSYIFIIVIFFLTIDFYNFENLFSLFITFIMYSLLNIVLLVILFKTLLNKMTVQKSTNLRGKNA